jgi:hydroxylamine reductase
MINSMKKYLTTPEVCGYGHEALTNLLVPPIQQGKVKKIYVVGGCDNLDPERDFYRQIALSLPKDAIVLTLGCGKFRLLGLKEKLGSV